MAKEARKAIRKPNAPFIESMQPDAVRFALSMDAADGVISTGRQKEPWECLVSPN